MCEVCNHLEDENRKLREANAQLMGFLEQQEERDAVEAEVHRDVTKMRDYYQQLSKHYADSVFRIHKMVLQDGLWKKTKLDRIRQLCNEAFDYRPWGVAGDDYGP